MLPFPSPMGKGELKIKDGSLHWGSLCATSIYFMCNFLHAMWHADNVTGMAIYVFSLSADTLRWTRFPCTRTFGQNDHMLLIDYAHRFYTWWFAIVDTGPSLGQWRCTLEVYSINWMVNTEHSCSQYSYFPLAIISGIEYFKGEVWLDFGRFLFMFFCCCFFLGGGGNRMYYIAPATIAL